MRNFLPNIVESALVGFAVGLVLGVATGHFLLSLVPAVVGAAMFAVGRIGVGFLTEEFDFRH